MPAKINHVRRASDDAQKALITAIRKGEIRTAAEAADRFDVSSATIFRWLLIAKDKGFEFATSGGEHWRVLRGPK